jgi:hypothetical protein
MAELMRAPKTQLRGCLLRAGFDGGAAGISGAVPLANDPSQQPLLTTPQHA